MSSFFKQAAKAARANYPKSTNVLMRVLEYRDCDVRDVSRNAVVGIDMLTGEKIEVFMAKNEKADSAQNPRRTVFEMKNGKENQTIPVGGSVIFTGVNELGKTGDVRRLRAYWSEGAIRKLARVNNDPNGPVAKDDKGNFKLDGHVIPGVLLRVNAPRPSATNPEKYSQRVQLLLAGKSSLIARLDPAPGEKDHIMTSLRSCLTEVLKNTRLGRPSVVLRMVQGNQMIVRTVGLRQDQEAADAVKDFLENDEFGKMLADALQSPQGLGEDVILEAIPQMTNYYAQDSVSQEMERIAKAKEISERAAANPNATPVKPPQTRFHPYSYAEKVPDRDGQPGATKTVIRQGFTLSHLALAPTKDRNGFVVANALPVSSDQEVLRIEEVTTNHVQHPCVMASSTEDDIGVDDGPIDGAAALEGHDGEQAQPASAMAG